jgi:hypothetical protein
MRSTHTIQALALAAALLPALAVGQDAPPAGQEWDEDYGQAPDQGQQGYPGSPDLQQQVPPPPPEATPAPAPPPGVPAGQWVQTDQYGWVWMPYADTYTYVPQSATGTPYMYVYYPVVGWTWLAAPWVWGIGPWPYFGVYGCVGYGWYGHGWWRTPTYWHYVPAPAPRPPAAPGPRGGYYPGAPTASRGAYPRSPPPGIHGMPPAAPRAPAFHAPVPAGAPRSPTFHAPSPAPSAPFRRGSYGAPAGRGSYASRGGFGAPPSFAPSRGGQGFSGGAAPHFGGTRGFTAAPRMGGFGGFGRR